jgi:predicted metal-dependent hydrolase
MDPLMPMSAASPPIDPPIDPCRRFLAGYPEALQDQVRQQLIDGRLGAALARNYPERHAVRTDAALYDHAMALKSRYLRNASALSKVVFDNRLQIDQRALGTLSSVSRVQGGRLAAKRELRVAALFKDAPAAMLEMIVVHELAHLKEREHNKPFYALCEHMLAGYHQVEFDTRLYLTWRANRTEVLAAG